jgi:thiol-disulfide isomerase/thioredoxin
MTRVFCAVAYLWIVLPLAAQETKPGDASLPAPRPMMSVQSPPVATGLDGKRPGEMYQQAMKPLDVVRSSLDNWSDTELRALTTGMMIAHTACDNAVAEGMPNEDLYDLIRLCALGQDWVRTKAIAQQYLATGDETHRAQAYAMSVNSQVHINDLEGAVKTAREMLHGLPYDAEVAYALRYLKTYLDQSVDPQALTLATEEHPILVEALKAGPVLKAAHGNAVIGTGELFESGMQLAFLQRYGGDSRGAERTLMDLQGAVGSLTGLSAEDKQLIDAAQVRYGLLAGQVSSLEAERIQPLPAAKVKLRSDTGFVTVFALLPEWCPQCLKTMKGLTEFAAEHVAAKVHGIGLIVRDETMGATNEEAYAQMNGTNLLRITSRDAAAFGAVDYPLIVVTDQHGTIYFVGQIPDNAFVPNGYMEQVIGRIVGEVAVVRNGPVGKGKAAVKKAVP